MKKAVIIGMSILGICGCLFISDRFQGYGKDAEYAEFQESWGEYQGEMTWSEALKKCENMEMILPSRQHFNAAKSTDLGSKFYSYGNAFWTSETSGDARAHAYGMRVRSDFIQFRTAKNHVVCIKSKP